MSAPALRPCSLALLALSSSTWVHAEERQPLELRWDAPPGCPDASAVLGRVDELLGAHRAPGEPVRVRATVTAEPEGFRLEISTEQGPTEQHRVLTASSCSELGEAASVVIALVVAPGADLEVATSAAPPSSGPPADARSSRGSKTAAVPPQGSPRRSPMQATGARKAAAIAVAAPSPAPARRADSHLVWLVGAGVEGDLGTLPEPAAGARIGAAVRPDADSSWEFGLSGVAFPPSRVTTIEGLPRGSATFTFFAAGLTGCRLVRARELDYEACVGWEMGGVSGEARNTDLDQPQSSVWLAPGAELGVGPWFGPFSLDLRAGLVVPLNRPKFTVSGLRDPVLHRSWPVAGRVTLTGRLRW
jgi:hypothetical protein